MPKTKAERTLVERCDAVADNSKRLNKNGQITGLMEELHRDIPLKKRHKHTLSGIYAAGGRVSKRKRANSEHFWLCFVQIRARGFICQKSADTHTTE